MRVTSQQQKSIAALVLEKAERMVMGEVQRISKDTYLVKSHSSPCVSNYLVKRNHNGIFTCSCKGFPRKKICSHTIAVMMFESRKHAAGNQALCFRSSKSAKPRQHAEKRLGDFVG